VNERGKPPRSQARSARDADLLQDSPAARERQSGPPRLPRPGEAVLGWRSRHEKPGGRARASASTRSGPVNRSGRRCTSSSSEPRRRQRGSGFSQAGHVGGALQIKERGAGGVSAICRARSSCDLPGAEQGHDGLRASRPRTARRVRDARSRRRPRPRLAGRATFTIVATARRQQVGKTTLARQIADTAPAPAFFDSGAAATVARLAGSRSSALAASGSSACSDEVLAPCPDAVHAARACSPTPRARLRQVSRARRRSASRTAARASESLARIAFSAAAGAVPAKVGNRRAGPCWLRGGFSRSFTARSAASSAAGEGSLRAHFPRAGRPQLGMASPRQLQSALGHAAH